VHRGAEPDASLNPAAASTPQGTEFAGLSPAPLKTAVAALRIGNPDGRGDVALGSVLGSRATVVAFWQTTCPPCADELPRLQAMAPGLERQGVRVLLVALQEEPAQVGDWLAKHRVSLTGYLDRDASAHNGLRLLGVPATAVLGPDAGVVSRLEGAGDLAGLLETLRSMGIQTQ
jgi:thiol-disulfide isomerase/thioredoxin